MCSQMKAHFRKWLISATLALVTLLIQGCSRPNPNPELLDPIYADLNSRSNVAKAAAESAKADIKRLNEEIKALPARDPTRKKTQEDLSKKEVQMMVAEQESLYYEIRAKQRLEYARTEYLKAFEKGEAWPDPNDFVTYKLQRKLRDAPREWSSKIPKTGRYNKKTNDDMRKELEDKLKASPGGEGGSH